MADAIAAHLHVFRIQVDDLSVFAAHLESRSRLLERRGQAMLATRLLNVSLAAEAAAVQMLGSVPSNVIDLFRALKARTVRP